MQIAEKTNVLLVLERENGFEFPDRICQGTEACGVRVCVGQTSPFDTRPFNENKFRAEWPAGSDPGAAYPYIRTQRVARDVRGRRVARQPRASELLVEEHIHIREDRLGNMGGVDRREHADLELARVRELLPQDTHCPLQLSAGRLVVTAHAVDVGDDSLLNPHHPGRDDLAPCVETGMVVLCQLPVGTG